MLIFTLGIEHKVAYTIKFKHFPVSYGDPQGTILGSSGPHKLYFSTKVLMRIYFFNLYVDIRLICDFNIYYSSTTMLLFLKIK